MEMKVEEEEELDENDNEMIEDYVQDEDELMIEDNTGNIDYEKFYEYKCTNTIDNFEKKNLKDNDDRRFEDA